MAYASKFGRARLSGGAYAICDRCGSGYNHADLTWQLDYAGSNLINKRILVCQRCLDTPQNQLRAIVIPADPIPISNPRAPNFVEASSDLRLTSGPTVIDQRTGLAIASGDIRITQDFNTRVLMQTGAADGSLNNEPGTDPNAPGNDDPGLPYENTEVPRVE